MNDGGGSLEATEGRENRDQHASSEADGLLPRGNLARVLRHWCVGIGWGGRGRGEARLVVMAVCVVGKEWSG